MNLLRSALPDGVGRTARCLMIGLFVSVSSNGPVKPSNQIRLLVSARCKAALWSVAFLSLFQVKRLPCLGGGFGREVAGRRFPTAALHLCRNGCLFRQSTTTRAKKKIKENRRATRAIDSSKIVSCGLVSCRAIDRRLAAWCPSRQRRRNRWMTLATDRSRKDADNPHLERSSCAKEPHAQ